MKQRYAVGYYNNNDRVNNPDWMESPHCRLVTFIYDNQDMFNIRYIAHDKEGNRAWILIDTKELLKAKDAFNHEDTTEVNDFIDLCQEYDKWQTACTCCDSITLNTIPYTYREYGGSIGRAYNCPMCSGLINRTASKISIIRKEKGTGEAIKTLIEVDNGTYVDEDAHKYCSCCDLDLRHVGIAKDGKEIIFAATEDKELERMSVEEYNKIPEEVEDYYVPTYSVDVLEGETDGYRCLECNTKVEEDKIKKLGL